MHSVTSNKAAQASESRHRSVPAQFVEKYALLGAWAIVVAIFGFL
jgi:hypothetical protein